MSTLETSNESRYKGHVKFFNSIKGYGFILPDNVIKVEGEEEVFVHHTAIHNSGGFKSLAEGEKIEYDLVEGPKGMQASNVTGPNGSSVRGDPRTYRQQSHASIDSHYRGNNNRGDPYNGGYMMGSFGGGGQQGSPFGYYATAIPAGFPPFMDIYGHHHHHHHQFQPAYYQQQQQQNNSINTANNNLSPIYYNYAATNTTNTTDTTDTTDTMSPIQQRQHSHVDDNNFS